MSSNRRFKSSLELSTSASGSPLIARPDAVVGNSTQPSIGHSQKHLLKKFDPPFERYQNIRKDIPDNIAQSFDGSIFPQCIRSAERIDFKDINSIKNMQADAILFGNISELKSGTRLRQHGGGPGLTSIQVEIKLVDRKTGEELIKMINRSTTDGDKVVVPIIRLLANLVNKTKR